MKKIADVLKNFLGEYLERLLIILAGFGIGVKVIVINHGIDPRNLNLDLMAADYVVLIFAPVFAALLSQLINKWLPEDNQDDDMQETLNDILEAVAE